MRQREGRASTGRPIPRERRARPARRPAREQRKEHPGRHCVPTFAGATTATPPARAPEPDGGHRSFSSSSRSRIRHPSAQSRPSRRLHRPTNAGRNAAAIPSSSQSPKLRHLRRVSAKSCKGVKADDGARTRDLRLGKPTLYQLSYVRKWPGNASDWRMTVLGPRPGTSARRPPARAGRVGLQPPVRRTCVKQAVSWYIQSRITSLLSLGGRSGVWDRMSRSASTTCLRRGRAGYFEG